MTLAEKLSQATWGGEGYSNYDGQAFIGTALAIGLAATAAAGSVGSAAIASHGAGKAADAQAKAANSAAGLEKQSADAALRETRRQYDINQANFKPFRDIGTSAAANYANLLGIPFGASGGADQARQTDSAFVPPNYAGMDFNALINSGDPNVSPNQQTTDQWTSGGTPFHNITSADGRSVAIRDASPTGPDLSSLVNPQLGAFGSMAKFAPPQLNESTDPGLQARLDEGRKIIEKSAAAKGSLITGGTAQDLTKFGQDYASSEYDKVYGRARSSYDDQLNRLAALFGGGQSAAAGASASGSDSARSIADILMTSGNNIGSTMQDAAAARATGYQNRGNIWGNSVGSLTDLIPLILKSRTPTPTSYPGQYGGG